MHIRKIHNREISLLADHLKRLSAEDRGFRFAANHVSDDWIDRYTASIRPNDVVLGAFDGDQLVGAVHVAFADDLAEIGVSVDSGWRARGVGADLFNRAIGWARNRRAKKLYTLCQSNNRSMLALANRLGMTIHRESGTAEAFLPLDPPDLATVSEQVGTEWTTVVDDWVAVVRSCHSLWSKNLHP